MSRREKYSTICASLIIIIISLFVIVSDKDYAIVDNLYALFNKEPSISSILELPEYSGSPYIVINNNEPDFDESYYETDYFEEYSGLDSLGRCGPAFANITVDLMPTSPRESIGMIKPTGWQTSKYDFIDNHYLYNRCHLIGFQLTGENANERNLITCTRYMNSVSMLEFENKVKNYIVKTKNHVLYRVTPIFEDDNLLATGVQMEAYSIEDKGRGIKFNVFIYNVQDGVEIDYKTGKNKLKNS